MHGVLRMSVVKSTNTVAVKNFKALEIQAEWTNNVGR
jgi:hypothetical protein